MLLTSSLESELLQTLREHPNVTLTALPSMPKSWQTSDKVLFLLTAPVKVLFQAWTLWSTLSYKTRPSQWMLVQNPPSIPTLIIVLAVCRLRNTKLVIDWHNFGYSILSMKLGSDHPLVRVSRLYELGLARYAYCHIAVTDAMCDVLKRDFGLGNVQALHDRPAPLFQILSEAQKHKFLTSCDLTSGIVEQILAKKIRLVVSATSWTADEDFSVLLSAMYEYSASATSDMPHLPELLVIVTGKGPLKSYYLRQIEQGERQQKLEMVRVRTAWLSFEDYASLLGAADLGVSLHTSSSGVDLPMKVVDMFGAGLPVLGYSNFKAWSELVKEDFNGLGFANSEQMAAKLKSLFDPTDQQLDRLRQGAVLESKRRWEAEWDPVAGKLFGLVQ